MDFKVTTITDINSKDLPPTGYVRLKTILVLLPIGKTSWWKGVREGRFPEAVKAGDNTTLWRVEDIRALFNKINSQQKKFGGRHGR